MLKIIEIKTSGKNKCIFCKSENTFEEDIHGISINYCSRCISHYQCSNYNCKSVSSILYSEIKCTIKSKKKVNYYCLNCSIIKNIIKNKKDSNDFFDYNSYANNTLFKKCNNSYDEVSDKTKNNIIQFLKIDKNINDNINSNNNNNNPNISKFTTKLIFSPSKIIDNCLFLEYEKNRDSNEKIIFKSIIIIEIILFFLLLYSIFLVNEGLLMKLEIYFYAENIWLIIFSLYDSYIYFYKSIIDSIMIERESIKSNIKKKKIVNIFLFINLFLFCFIFTFNHVCTEKYLIQIIIKILIIAILKIDIFEKESANLISI